MTGTDARSFSDNGQEGARILGFYGVLLANLASFGVLFFWIIGAMHLLTGNGGLMNELGLDGLALVLFWAYPLVVVLSLAAWLLYFARLDLPALAVAGSPVGLVVLYYLWLVMARGVA